MVVMVNVFGVTRDQCHCCTVWDLMNETKDKKKKVFTFSGYSIM